MAFTLADAVVLFKGDDSPLKGALDTTQNKLSSWGGAATKIIGGAVAAGALTAGAAIVGIGVAAFDVSKQTDKAAADMAASLGIPREEADKFAEVARRVYGNNFADSVGDAASAVQELARIMGKSADDADLQGLAEDAFRLRDAFGVDVAESVDAAKTLMDNFGVSGDEAFNMIAAGYQKGLDRSGDFLDTIGEYSVQFAAGGATAGEFFSLLDSGLQGGMLGTDKAADAFKEFRVRIADGSKTTADALAQIGINVDHLTAGMSNGTISAADAFTLVQEALNATEDPVTRMQAGVGLLGTQYEDLGDQVANALKLNNDWAAGTAGAIESIDQKYATFDQAVTGVWRRLTVSIAPFTDKLLELVNDAMPAVLGAFDKFDATVGPTMERAQAIIDGVVNFIKGLFAGVRTSADADLTGPMAYWKDWLDQNMPRIQQIIAVVLGAIQAFWAQWGDTIMFVIQNTFSVAVTIIDTAMRTIGDLITLVLQLLTGDWEGAGQTILGIVQRLFDTLWTVFTTQLDSLRAIFTNIDWAGAGEAILNGIQNGIRNAWDGLKSWFRGKLQELTNMLPFSEPRDSSSPLRGLGRSGESLVKNFREGADREMDRLRGSFGNGLQSLVGNLTVAPAAGGGGGGISIGNISVYLTNGGVEEGRQAGRGILEELRRRGLA